MFDISVMKDICLAPIEAFNALGEVHHSKDGQFIFLDNGADILAIAHLDTVCDAAHFNYVVDKHGNRRVYTPTLDDRLGATIILDVLPQLGLKYDILLTEGEEVGASTAFWFDPPKEYKWMFSFDRGGVDVVHYQYTEPAWLKALETFGVAIKEGLFSDISFMDHVGCCGVNIGCAYYAYHSKKAYCVLDETEDMIRRFVLFYNEHKDTKFEYIERNTTAGSGWSKMSWSTTSYKSSYYDDWWRYADRDASDRKQSKDFYAAVGDFVQCEECAEYFETDHWTESYFRRYDMVLCNDCCAEYDYHLDSMDWEDQELKSHNCSTCGSVIGGQDDESYAVYGICFDCKMTYAHEYGEEMLAERSYLRGIGD